MGFNQEERIKIDGWTYNPDFLRHGDKVLLVDDVFDSGRTINYLARVIMNRGLPRNDVKIACTITRFENISLSLCRSLQIIGAERST